MMWNNYNQNPYVPYNNYLYNNSTSPYQQQSSMPNYQTNNQYQNKSQNNIIWVSGKQNARSMQLQPNSTMILLDNQQNKFYIKTTDDIGLGRLRVFNYTEENDNVEQSNTSNGQQINQDYITRKQLEEIITMLKGELKHEQSLSTAKSDSKQPIIIKKQ